MCGIAGIIHQDKQMPVQENVLCAMRDVISHRGPDDLGIFIDKGVGLAHRRLSIIDLGSGHQPMYSPDKKQVIVFNGEIYNYLQLKSELEKTGSVFRTSSDTEVILEMYRQYGEQCAARLNGIFAFAIWDKEQKKLFLARDHMGVKPLYYCAPDNSFVFASEAKALFESGLVSAECNFDAVPEYFMFRHVAGENTLFNNVKNLLPGHYMVVDDHGIAIERYWDPLCSPPPAVSSFDEAVEELDRLLADAIKLQLMSDVPLGTFCSGGIDSSLVTGIAAQNAGQSINTFSVGFYEQDYDETRYARMVSEKYATNHHELRLNEQEFTDYLSRLVWYNDEPLNFANSVHIYAISMLAKQYVTVVLTGEGSDELFAGYPRYQIPRLAAQLQNLPGIIQWLAKRAMSLSNDHRINKLRSFLDSTITDTMIFNSSPVGIAKLKDYSLENYQNSLEYRNNILSSTTDNPDTVRQVSLLDQNSYLISILNRQDKMSMAASIESRVPFLDYRIVEFANSLPVNYKIKGAQTKHILKKVAEKYLPNDVIYRRKSGFGVPLPNWLKSDGAFGSLANDMLSGEPINELGNKINLGQLLSDHRTGKKDHSEIIWTALSFVLWKKAFNIN